MNYRCINNNL